MFSWLQFFFRLCLLKVAPQEAPSTQFVQSISFFAFWLSSSLFFLLLQNFTVSVILGLIQVLLISFLLQLGLWITNTPERSVQARTALFGSGATLLFILVPVLSWLIQMNSETNYIFSLVGVFAMIWSILVLGNILHHTFDIQKLAGIGIAIVYIFMTFAITLRILKVLAISNTI